MRTLKDPTVQQPLQVRIKLGLLDNLLGLWGAAHYANPTMLRERSYSLTMLLWLGDMPASIMSFDMGACPPIGMVPMPTEAGIIEGPPTTGTVAGVDIGPSSVGPVWNNGARSGLSMALCRGGRLIGSGLGG